MSVTSELFVKEPYMQQLKVFLKEAAHEELLPTIRRFVAFLHNYAADVQDC